MTRDVLGLDIGGANLKAAHSRGGARLLPFPLWKQPDQLADRLRDLLRDGPSYATVAVTMTGELCDCYESRRAGVAAILDAVADVVGDTPVRIWRTDGQFVAPDVARTEPLKTASANWLALATFAGRFAPQGPALLVDVGSTTTDVIPLRNGTPAPRGRTDAARMVTCELVYTGVGRTPVCAITRGWGAAEVFATTRDVYLLTGNLPEEPTDTDTADGRPATREAAHRRLARIALKDAEDYTEEAMREFALGMMNRQIRLVAEALEVVASGLPGPPQTVLVSGVGEFLALKALQQQILFPPCRVLSLAQCLGREVSQAACAHAVARLAAERAE